ncbi:MAG: cysteine--tRNA ligase, partial [Eggerthellaceae bacterium]|nr:cysteine--tRNA ligase [Eggerthellaceae bacterium]
ISVFGIYIVYAAEGESDYPVEVIELAKKWAGYGGDDPEEAIEALLEERARARREKEWDIADAVRDGLIDLGFIIEDTPQGARVTFEG